MTIASFSFSILFFSFPCNSVCECVCVCVCVGGWVRHPKRHQTNNKKTQPPNRKKSKYQLESPLWRLIGGARYSKRLLVVEIPAIAPGTDPNFIANNKKRKGLGGNH